MLLIALPTVEHTINSKTIIVSCFAITAPIIVITWIVERIAMFQSAAARKLIVVSPNACTHHIDGEVLPISSFLL